MPKAIEMITTKAPKSGSLSNNDPTSTIATNIGKKAFLRLCITFILRTVKSAA